jgi:hypothetical protein
MKHFLKAFFFGILLVALLPRLGSAKDCDDLRGAYDQDGCDQTGLAQFLTMTLLVEKVCQNDQLHKPNPLDSCTPAIKDCERKFQLLLNANGQCVENAMSCPYNDRYKCGNTAYIYNSCQQILRGSYTDNALFKLTNDVTSQCSYCGTDHQECDGGPLCDKDCRRTDSQRARTPMGLSGNSPQGLRGISGLGVWGKSLSLLVPQKPTVVAAAPILQEVPVGAPEQAACTIATVAGGGAQSVWNILSPGVPATGDEVGLFLAEPRAVAVDGTNGVLYISDFARNAILKVQNGVASLLVGGAQSVDSPWGIAFDGNGNLYFAEYRNKPRIQKVDVNTRAVTPFIDNPGGYPKSLAIEGGELYVGLGGENDGIWKVGLNDNQHLLTPVALGPGYQSFDPLGVAVAGDGTVFISDTEGYRIMMKAPTWTGTIPVPYGVDPPISKPEGIAVDGSKNLYVAETLNHRVLLIGPNGHASVLAGTGEAGFSGDGGLPQKAKLNFPTGVALDREGNVYITEMGINGGSGRVRKVTPCGVPSGSSEPGLQ